MQVSESIQCPFCGQTFDLTIDTSVSSQRFTTIAKSAAAPSRSSWNASSGEILSLDVQGS